MPYCNTAKEIQNEIMTKITENTVINMEKKPKIRDDEKLDQRKAENSVR